MSWYWKTSMSPEVMVPAVRDRYWIRRQLEEASVAAAVDSLGSVSAVTGPPVVGGAG